VTDSETQKAPKGAFFMSGYLAQALAQAGLLLEICQAQQTVDVTVLGLTFVW
jgi:hypothetical protein